MNKVIGIGIVAALLAIVGYVNSDVDASTTPAVERQAEVWFIPAAGAEAGNGF